MLRAAKGVFRYEERENRGEETYLVAVTFLEHLERFRDRKNVHVRHDGRVDEWASVVDEVRSHERVAEHHGCDHHQRQSAGWERKDSQPLHAIDLPKVCTRTSIRFASPRAQTTPRP